MAICGGCVPSKPAKVFCYSEDDQFDQYCNYTMPSGSVIQLWNFDKVPSPDDGPGFQVVSGGGGYYKFSKADHAYVANFDLMGAPYGSFGTITNQVFSASECALWMCVQTYHTTTKSGNQNQTVVSQINNLDVQNIIASNGLYGGPALEATFSSLPAPEDPNQVTKFTVDRLASAALQNWLSLTITGTIKLNLEAQIYSSDLVQGIWNGTQDLNAWINNVATSVTGVIRTTNVSSQPEFEGTAKALGIRVRWIWLLLPLTLVTLSLLIILAVVVRTSRSPVQAWKGSPLTFLLFGIDEQMREAARGLGLEHDGLQKAIGSKVVRLVEDEGTLWKFKTC